MKAVSPLAASYRDPAGFIFTYGGELYRQINQVGKADFDYFISSGLYKALCQGGLLVEHTEVQDSKTFPPDKNRYKVIKPALIPFISYPYEWSYAQLRDAATATLRIQQIALEHGMILKDASAYNVQFIGKQPIFIDTLSFAIYEPGKGWEGYRQFCEHFLAPLAVARYSSAEALKMLQTYTEGIPLALAVRWLPARAKLRKGLLAHLYLHAASQKRHQGSGNTPKKARSSVSTFALQGLLASLERTVRSLQPKARQTEWDKYYTFTNYSDSAFTDKRQIVEAFLQQINPQPKLVWDLGANNGEFSALAVEHGAYTVALDIDAQAVQANYRNRAGDLADERLLPLVQDIVAPSPALGWELEERSSLVERGPADVLLALALIHHLAIGRNVPLPRVARLLATLGSYVVIEFVPKSDSKVQHLLASRPDIFSEYDQAHFEAAMAESFTLIDVKPVADSERRLYLYKNKKGSY